MIEQDILYRIEGNLISSRQQRLSRSMDNWSAFVILFGVVFFGLCIYLTAEPEAKADDKARALADLHLHNTSTFLY